MTLLLNEVNQDKRHLIMFRGNVVRVTNTPNGTTVNFNHIQSPDINFDKI